MKFFISCVLVIFCSSSAIGLLSHEAILSLQRDQDDCVRESGVTRSTVEQAHLDRVIHNDENMAKFAACMLKKFNVMSDDGKINEDVYSYHLISDNPAMFETAEKCKKRTGSDVDETASKIMTCFLNSDVFVLDPYIGVHKRA
ncbi:uncharacterized protein LOC100679743 [Nasonia vitripennis]|uniref:Putative odorant binding protein 58 n=1 Tax=Nasonia vitripennis TaxID=7425 RepID=G8B1R3_NASVI|nr:uncharacterized protein LOC100679743 [Nasonia vitripennis]CCD17827.1 putative odorant binding protein 58 [Nasonia vitripennis]